MLTAYLPRSLKSASILFPAFLVLLISGCAYCLMGGTNPYPVKLQLQTDFPERCLVIVDGGEISSHSVNKDGRVEFTIPAMPKACRVVMPGGLTLHDYSATGRKVVHVYMNGKIKRALSISEIEKMPETADGWRTLKVR